MEVKAVLKPIVDRNGKKQTTDDVIIGNDEEKVCWG